MKTQTQFKNASLVSVMNGSIVVKSAAEIEHTFTNASVVSINNGTIIIESKWMPTQGELIKVLNDNIDCYVIFNNIEESSLFAFGSKEIHGSYYRLDNDRWIISEKTDLYPVTPEEQKEFDDFCKSQGKIWNKEKLQWEKYKWIPETYENYYFISSSGEVEYTKNDTYNLDLRLIKYGNCFQTRKEAETAAEKLKEFFKSL